MSEWTDKANEKDRGRWVAQKAIKAVEDKKFNSNMDREGLLNELNHYKRFSLQQYETIRLLKVEIMKIKKLAAGRIPSAKRNPPEWMKEQDPKNLKVKDEKDLRDEMMWLK